MNSSTFSINTLSDEDTLYLENLMIDLRSYINNLHTHTYKKCVLVFPPVNNFRRFLIHHLVDNTFKKEKLSTLSIGSLYARRTVVYPSVLKPMEVKCSEVVTEQKNTAVKKVSTVPIYRPPALRNNEIENSCHRKERKMRKPDMQIYIPRGRRLLAPIGAENQLQDDENVGSPYSGQKLRLNIEGVQMSKKQKVVSASSSPEKPKNDKCVPASLDPNPVIDIAVKKSIYSFPMEDTVYLDSENDKIVDVRLDDEQVLVVEDSFMNTPVGKRTESTEFTSNASVDITISSRLNYDPNSKHDSSTSSLRDDNAVTTSEVLLSSTISNEKHCDISVTSVKEESQSGLHSKTCVMDIAKTEVTSTDKSEVKEAVVPQSKSSCDEAASATVSAKDSPSLNVNDCEWDELFNDEGEYVDKSLLNELMTAIGKVSVQHAVQDYKAFQTDEERTSDGGCVLEIYGFPSEFKTDDLFAVFASYRSDPGFQIVWVDDTHALAVFSSPTLADEVLNTVLPFVKTRPIKNAIPKSRMKAQNFIPPPMSRPKTCASLARRLVSGHLGMKINVTDQQKAAERKILSDAREKRRLIAKQRQEAWEGEMEKTS